MNWCPAYINQASEFGETCNDNADIQSKAQLSSCSCRRPYETAAFHYSFIILNGSLIVLNAFNIFTRVN